MLDKALAVYPASQPYAAHLAAGCAKFGINTPARIAMFVAQLAHESGQFKLVREGLNYSAEALARTWPSRFPDMATANRYARNPKAIANKVYANRMGNGDEASGDGWRYSGRGLIQLTGKDNYRFCSRNLYGDERLIADPDQLAEPIGAAMSSCWFWDSKRLNTWADTGDVKSCTRLINGGLHGLEDRIVQFDRVKKALA